MYTLEIMPQLFCVCKLPDMRLADLSVPFTFAACTDNENSLVCPEENTPPSQSIEKGWRGMRIACKLDFSLTGVLAPIANILAENRIGIFAVSTFDTDYIFIKEENLAKAQSVLSEAGYSFKPM